MQPALPRTDQHQGVLLWEMCLGRGTPLCSGTAFWEVSGLRNSRESERERETKSYLCSLTLDKQTECMTQDCLSSLCLGEHSDLRGRGQS